MKKENMNNKGFSLVELIIVIAIMAILIVVLAPQYLKYVERSRNSTDLQNARTMMTAIETYAADPQVTGTDAFVKDDTFTMQVRNDKTTVTGGASAKAKKALNDAALLKNDADIKCSSRTKRKQYDVKGTIQEDGSVKWEYDSDPANNFANAMKGNS